MGTNVAYEEGRGQDQEPTHFSFSKFVTPFTSYFHWALCTPFHIVFEQETCRYVCKDGSLLFKLLAASWQSLQFIYILWGCTISPIYDSDALGSAKFLHRLGYIFYALYQAIWLRLMWKGFRKLPQILNQGNLIYRNVLGETPVQVADEGRGRVCFKSWEGISFMGMVSFLTFGLMSVFSTLSLIYTLITANMSKEERSHQDPEFLTLFDNFLNRTMSSFCRVGNIWCVIQEYYHCLAYLVTSVWIVIILFCETSWQVSVYMLAIWALYFRKLLSLIVRQINKAESQGEIFGATTIFAKLCLLVEEFNGIFGWLLLITLIDTVLYKTITFAIVFGGYSPGVEFSISYLVMSVVPSCIMLYFMADVHKLGSTVPNILKRKYLLENGESESDPLTVGEVHRSLIAHNDVLANGIGFKGAGFFTISFAFVGSLLGITITYTVVMLEFTDK